MAIARLLRAVLDALYFVAGILAALSLLGVFVLIVAQMIARWSGVSLRGSTDYAGYLMAASSFLAFAAALNRGSHIRVTMLREVFPSMSRVLEIWALAVGSAISAYIAWYACKAVYWSWKLGDLSQGLDATPLWIPQIAMAVGTILFAVAFLDNLVRYVVTGSTGIGSGAQDTVHQVE
jgi:TRAP-type C4-dicarboxylate transport system permease small subunit